MPKVPLYSPEVRQTQAAPVAQPVQLKIPAEAFGANVQEARAASGEAGMRAASLLSNRVIEMQQREDEKDVLQKQVQFQTELQDTLNNQETNDKDVPKGLLNRNLGQANGATVEYDQTAQQLKERYMSSVAGAESKVMMAKILDSHLINGREQVIRHEADQREKDYRNALDTSIKTNVQNAAALSDPESVSRAIAAAQVSASSGLSHLGLDGPSIAAANKNLAGDMVKSAVSGVLEANPKAAQAILDGHKEAIPATVVADLQKTIDGKLIFDKQIDTWNGLRGLRLSDGKSNMEAMQKKVYAMEVPTQQKDQIWDFVKASAATQDRELESKRASVDRDFLNELYDFKGKGGGLASALSLGQKFGYDTTDIATKQEAIRKLYANKNETDPLSYVTMWDRVQNNLATKEDLVKGLSDGKLSNSDFQGLWKELARIQVEGSSPADKAVADRIKILTDQKIGSNKDKKASFEYTVMQLGKGKTPEEKWKLANDLLAKDDASGWLFKDKQWETGLKQLDAQNLAWGKVYQDVGRPQVTAIGQGLLLAGGKPNWSLKDVTDFADQFGGMEAIKPGTPTNNAMLSLQRRGELVTAGNVKAVLSKFSNGMY